MSRVPFYTDWLGIALDHAPGVLKKLGQIETKLLKYDTLDLEIKKPVFITGLARSGSTILLEILNDHPQTTSYQYGDYPFIHLNFFWNTLRKLIPSNPEKTERAHKDRIKINAQSPEALDEIIWMSFFKDLHDPEISNILGAKTQNPEFEKFYKDGLLKLMSLRKAKRIALKNNYNISRLLYLHKLFPDARFILPVRRPEAHIYSLIKQHKIILHTQQKDPRAARYMRRHGHFEFGQDFRPMNLNDSRAATIIRSAWHSGNLVHAYALYWAETHLYLHKILKESPALKEACTLVRYDDLCTTPSTEIQKILKFCDLENEKLCTKWTAQISAPTYYECNFTQDEKEVIKDLTHKTEKLFWPA